MPTTIKVFGNIKDVSRFAKRCTITIKLINGPINEDPNLIVPTELVRQTDETGYFEAPLGLGNYGLFIGSDQILFSVTDLGSGDKNIVSLLNEDLSYTRDPYNSNWNGLRQGNIQFLYVAAPKVFTVVTFDSAGAHLPGLSGTQYQYFCTFLTALGETPASPFVGIDLFGSPDGYCARLTFNVADTTANVTKRRVWRSISDEFQEFQVIAELDPAVATFDDVLPYGGYVGGPAPVPDHNTTAGAIYANTVQLAQLSPEAGFDIPFRLCAPYAKTLAFDREMTLNILVVDGIGVPVLQFRKNAGNWTIGKVFTGFNQPGIVPNPATGYSGTRFLREDGTWQTPSGGGGSDPFVMSFLTIETYNGSDNDIFSIVGNTGDQVALELSGDPTQNANLLFEPIADVIANASPIFFRGAGSHDLGIAIATVGPVWNCEAGTGNMHFFYGQTWFGSGNFFNLGHDSYMLATCPAGSSAAGFTANRGDTDGYSSFDLLTGEDPSTGWSMQMQPSGTDLLFRNRVMGISQLLLAASGESFFYGNLDVGGTASFASGICTINGFGQLYANDVQAGGNVIAGGNFECAGSDGATEDVTVLVTALGLTTVLHFVGGIYIGRD